MRSCSVTSSPTRATPSSTAVIARNRAAGTDRGDAAVERGLRSAGAGKPNGEKMVDSSATTGVRLASASATSSAI